MPLPLEPWMRQMTLGRGSDRYREQECDEGWRGWEAALASDAHAEEGAGLDMRGVGTSEVWRMVVMGAPGSDGVTE